MERRNPVVRIIIFVFFIVMTLSFVYPLYYMFINSLKTKTEYSIDPFTLPKEIFLTNYATMISQFKIFLLFRNTAVVAVGSVVLLLVFGILSSYTFAKIKFKGRQWVYLAIVCTMFIPPQVTLIPAYVMFAKMNLVNNFWSVILSYLASSLPGAIMLLVSNFRGISNDMLEAAKIDGCNYLQTVRNIVVPMGLPVIAITIIFNFMFFWNDLFTPMILLQKMEVRTVIVALATLMTRYTSDPPYQLAGLMLSAVPAILVYIIFQRQIVKGMTMGSFR